MFYYVHTMQLRCGRCGARWEYKGRAEVYACCPQCRSKVKIDQVGSPLGLERWAVRVPLEVRVPEDLPEAAEAALRPDSPLRGHQARSQQLRRARISAGKEGGAGGVPSQRGDGRLSDPEGAVRSGDMHPPLEVGGLPVRLGRQGRRC